MKAFWFVGTCTVLTVGLVAAKTVHGAQQPQQKAAAKPAAVQTSAPGPNDPTKFFDDKVRPILAQNCYKCHTERTPWAGCGWIRAKSILKGGDSGAGDGSG